MRVKYKLYVYHCQVCLHTYSSREPIVTLTCPKCANKLAVILQYPRA